MCGGRSVEHGTWQDQHWARLPVRQLRLCSCQEAPWVGLAWLCVYGWARAHGDRSDAVILPHLSTRARRFIIGSVIGGSLVVLCPQPSLTERTVDDHRQLPARYGAMGSALRGRLAAVLLHHVGARPPWGIFWCRLVPLIPTFIAS